MSICFGALSGKKMFASCWNLGNQSYQSFQQQEIEYGEADYSKAYKKMAVLHHPDKNPNDPNATAKFQEVLNAYQTLSAPEEPESYSDDEDEDYDSDSSYECDCGQHHHRGHGGGGGGGYRGSPFSVRYFCLRL